MCILAQLLSKAMWNLIIIYFESSWSLFHYTCREAVNIEKSASYPLQFLLIMMTLLIDSANTRKSSLIHELFLCRPKFNSTFNCKCPWGMYGKKRKHWSTELCSTTLHISQCSTSLSKQSFLAIRRFGFSQNLSKILLSGKLVFISEYTLNTTW